MADDETRTLTTTPDMPEIDTVEPPQTNVPVHIVTAEEREIKGTVQQCAYTAKEMARAGTR